MPSRVDLFLQAKQIIRVHPEYSDERVAEECGTTPRDVPGMRTIAEARKDVAASDIRSPHLPS